MSSHKSQVGAMSQQHLISQSPSLPNYLAVRRPWIIVSLPLTIATLVLTSAYFLSVTFVHGSIQNSLEAPPSQPEGRVPWATEWIYRLTGSSTLGCNVLSSSSWPGIPYEIVEKASDEGLSGDLGSRGTFQELAESLITDECLTKSAITPRRFTTGAMASDTDCQEGYQQAICEEIAGDDITVDSTNQCGMAMQSYNSPTSESFPMSRPEKRATKIVKIKEEHIGSDVKSTMDDEDEDEDDNDHFPSNLKQGDDTSENDRENDSREESDSKSNERDIVEDNRHDSTNKNKRKQKQKLNQNANLGSTGGNGPILLCSSKSCIPQLRDAILSKIAVQISHVMDHLRNRQTLLHMMELTAPETKDSLMATQEELVDRLEQRVLKSLRSWVMGIREKNNNTSIAISTSTPPNVDNSKLGGSDAHLEDTLHAEGEYETVANLGLENVDDDGKGLSLKPIRPHPSIRKKQRQHGKHSQVQTMAISNIRHDTSETFVSADKVLMRQEWSRWIAHWIHRGKVTILSFSLATQTLNDMNQIVIIGDNVDPVDKRHWSWNVDKALATLMVASEMLCGGPATDPALTASLSTPGEARTMALTLNAKHCIEAWSDELESILEETGTTAEV